MTYLLSKYGETIIYVVPGSNDIRLYSRDYDSIFDEDDFDLDELIAAGIKTEKTMEQLKTEIVSLKQKNKSLESDMDITRKLNQALTCTVANLRAEESK